MRGNISLAVEKVEVAGVPLWCDTSTSQLRPLVPVVYCKTVFEAVHGLAHPGIRATRRSHADLCGRSSLQMLLSGVGIAKSLLRR